MLKKLPSSATHPTSHLPVEDYLFAAATGWPKKIRLGFCLATKRNKVELRLVGASISARFKATIVGRNKEETMKLHIELF